ncbi:MAG: nucleotidyltransferase domain-containing protein [Planctomycetaceae bacterium]
MLATNLNVSKSSLADFCRSHSIRRLAFFGSVVRDDFGPESDVDCLVEFREGHHPGWSIVELEAEFSKLVGGRKVQFVNPKYLNRHMRDRILTEAEEQYVGEG